MYVIFIDFKKAYDRVWREGLWERLRQIGIGEKTVRMIQTLYRDHKRKIATPWGDTDWSECKRGLKQGCVLSPILFALYISDLEARLKEGGEGVKCGTEVIPGFFFADDLVAIAVGEEGIANSCLS